MANQGGTHEQHVKAGQQSHKNSSGKSASSTSDAKKSGSSQKSGAKAASKSK